MLRIKFRLRLSIVFSDLNLEQNLLDRTDM